MIEPRGLILFARSPEIGRVKTRLEPALGNNAVLSLYRKMLQQQLSMVENFSHAACEIWVDGDTGHEDFKQLRSGIRQQEGRDLGERMCLAMADALERFETAVLIGCDCPDLDEDYLLGAFHSLEQGYDAVFGPATDGGYVLIGLKNGGNKGYRHLFENIDWGTEQVMEQTRSSLGASGMRWRELSPLRDIDEPADLQYLPEHYLDNIG